MPSGTVHLWKSRKMASKGYIHCTYRINLRKWKYQFTLESLPQPNNSNSYRTPHCKHRSMVRISEWLRDCTTLFSFLDPRSSIIETQDSILASWDSILASRNSKRSSLETQGSSYKFRGSSVNLLLSGTVSIILYNFYTWLKKHRRLRSIHHRQGGFKDLWVYMLISKANSFRHHKFTLSWASRVDANPWSALFKAYNCVFMQSAKKAFRSYLMFSSVC